MLLLPNVLPGQLPGVPSKHAAAVCYDCEGICYDFDFLTQGTSKLGLNSLEVQGAEKSGVGRPGAG